MKPSPEKCEAQELTGRELLDTLARLNRERVPVCALIATRAGRWRVVEATPVLKQESLPLCRP